VAVDGREAVARFCAERFDLVFMDCNMPGVDGFAAAAEIRAQVGERARTPIIAVTANAMTGHRERCLAAGMDDYLAKPFRAQVLRSLIERWLDQTTDPKAAGARPAGWGSASG